MGGVNLPQIKMQMEDVEDDVRLQKILSYLYRLNEQLRYELTNIDDDNITEEGITKTAAYDALNRTITGLNGEMLKLYANARKLSIQLESKVTEKDIADAIADIDEFHNTAIDITALGVLIKTTGAIRAIIEDIERLVIDDAGVRADLITADTVHAKNIVEKQLQSAAEWKGGIQSSLDALPKYMAQETTLTIPAGTYIEDVRIAGFEGARLNVLLGDGVYINGKIVIENCKSVKLHAAVLGDASVYAAENTLPTLQISGCQSAEIVNVQVSGYRGRTSAEDGTRIPVYAVHSNVRMHGCCIEYATLHAVVFEGGTFDCYDCIGGAASTDPATNCNLGNSVIAYLGAHGVLRGKSPMSANGAGGSSGTLIQLDVVPTAGGMRFELPDAVTKTYQITKHCTYLYGVRRIRDDQSQLISQGRYGTDDKSLNNWRTGAMWFGGAAADLQGRTILRASITLRRASGGRSSAINVYAGAALVKETEWEDTLRPEFVPVSGNPVGALLREADIVIDVTELMSYVQAGQAIAVQEPVTEYMDIMSDNYSTFYGKGSSYAPTLTVEYK